MCEQTEINYLDGDVVWVKLGACWWPGQVTGLHNLPEDIQIEFQKKPLIAAVKFFQEDTYEFVKNYQQIYKYNCTQKEDFIKKGLDKFRTKSRDGASYMDKFPGDIEMAEKLTGGDPDILTSEKFSPEEKPDISGLFGEKKIPKKKRDRYEAHRRSDGSEMLRKITHPRFLRESDHEVRIRHQPSSLPSTPNNSTSSPQYPCHLCSFTSSRVNVIICHIKSHNSGGSPAVARSKVKTYSPTKTKEADTDTPKRKYVRKDKGSSHKSRSEGSAESGKRKLAKQVEKASKKKKKTDPEIREKLLADWNDSSDEDMSMDLNKSMESGTVDSSPMKSQMDTTSPGDDKQKNENDDIIQESEKLLNETEKLTAIEVLEDTIGVRSRNSNNKILDDSGKNKSNMEKDKDTKKDQKPFSGQKNKKPELQKDGKKLMEKDDKKSRLSCFDFDEEDVPEATIPPVRKIHRVFGEKSLSLKKEIIKEFEMSQALKEEQEKDLSNDKNTETKDTVKKNDIVTKSGTQETPEEHENKDNKMDDDMDEETNKLETEEGISVLKKQSKEDKASSKNEREKVNSNACETQVEIVEIFEVEREEEADDERAAIANKNFNKALISNIITGVKHIDKEYTKTDDEALTSAKNEETIEKKDITSEKIEMENEVVSETMESSKLEALPEKMEVDTEDETVSESADTAPPHSETSDTDMTPLGLNQSDDTDMDNESILGNLKKVEKSPVEKPVAAHKSVKKRRGRPRRSLVSEKTSTETSVSSVDDSSSKSSNKSPERKLGTKMIIEKDKNSKTTESDSERSLSGRRRKPNRKYSYDIYLQNSDASASKTDDSQSELDDKLLTDEENGERIERRPARSRKSSRFGKRTIETVIQMDQQEIELSDSLDRTADVVEESMGGNRAEKSEQKAGRNKASTMKKSDEMKSSVGSTIELIKSDEKLNDDRPSMDKVLKTIGIPTVLSEHSSESTRLTKVSETKWKIDERQGEIIEQTDDFEDEDRIKDDDDRTPSIQEQVANLIKEAEGNQVLEVPKTEVEKLPPKKSQIKKFELAQNDFFEGDASVDKNVIQPEPENRIDKTNDMEIEITRVDTDKESTEIFSGPVIEEQVISTEDTEILEEKIETVELMQETVIEEVPIEQADMTIEREFFAEKEKGAELQENVDTQLKLEGPKKILPKTEMEIELVSKSETVKTPEPAAKRPSMQTRYKGKFTPETGSKPKKDKDSHGEEKPVNTFQEAFLKTLQMDKRDNKVVIDDIEITVGRGKVKKPGKKKADEMDNVNIVPVTQTVGPIKKAEKVAANIESAEDTSKLHEQTNVSGVGEFQGVEVVVEENIEIEAKTDEPTLTVSAKLPTPPEVPVSKREVQPGNIEEITKSLTLEVQKMDDSSRLSSVSTPSPTSDVGMPVKKREKPRIIENVTLKEPMILKTKLLEKLPAKGQKHKLELDVSKRGDTKSSPRAKIMKLEPLSPNSKGRQVKIPTSHLSLTKKLQALKAEEAATTAMETQKEKLISQASQGMASVPSEKFIQQSSQSLADMELDINSMPFVLSEDVLTPENLEQMPVVISSIIPSSSTIATNTISLTPTTQIVAPNQTQFKSNEIESTPKKKSGTPTILKNKAKAKPTITNIKTLVPPLTGGVKGLKFQNTQPGKAAAPLISQKSAPGKYVIVQTAGGKQIRYSVQGKPGSQQKIAIPSSKGAGSAQIVQQGGKVVILTSAQSGQTKMLPLNISKNLGGKVQRIMTSKGTIYSPISSQGIMTSKTVIAPKTEAGTATTSKLAGQSQKIINTQGIITSKGVLTPISGTISKSALLGTLSQGILTKGGIYTPISASSLAGKTIIGSKALVTKGPTYLSPLTSQSLGGTKTILGPMTQTIAGKTILSSQGIVTSKGTVLTPITAQQVKAIAAKTPAKGGKVQYSTVPQKMQVPLLQKCQKIPISSSSSQMRVAGSIKSPGSTIVLQNTVSGQKTLLHGKKLVKQTVGQGMPVPALSSQSPGQQTQHMQLQTKGKVIPGSSTVQKVVMPRGSGRQSKNQKIVVQKLHESPVAVQNLQQKQTSTVASIPPVTKSVAQQKHSAGSVVTPKAATKNYTASAKNAQPKNLLNVALNSINVTTPSSATISTPLSLPPLEPTEPEKKTKVEEVPEIRKEEPGLQSVASAMEQTTEIPMDKIEEPKVAAAQPQIMALPTESGDGTQTYVLVTIDEQGQIQPLDNNALMSLEGTTQNPDGTRTLYIDPSSLGEAGALDNIVLQFDNGCMPNLQTSTAESNQTMVSESFPSSEIIQTSNQDILAAALANTDFQQEIGLPENSSGTVMSSGLTQTSLINQTILQSTIIPPTEPISSPSVLETSLTLNQPIMTPLEVPSNLSIQSESTPASDVSTIPSSLELPITITNPSISYISAGDTQIQIPGNSMPDIGEIMESSATDMTRTVSTQYLVIPNLDENVTIEAQGIQSGAESVPSVSYSVSIPEHIVLDTTQVQTTPSMPIIDDSYSEDAQFTATMDTSMASEQSFADVSVSEMLVSKASTISTENVPPQDITATSKIATTPQEVPATSQEPSVETETSAASTASVIQAATSEEVEMTSEDLMMQHPTVSTQEDSVIHHDIPMVSQEEINQEVISKAEPLTGIQDMSIDQHTSEVITSSMPVIDENCSVSSESNIKVQSTMSLEVADSAEIPSGTSQDKETSNKLEQLIEPTPATSQAPSSVEDQAAASRQEEENLVPTQALPSDTLGSAQEGIVEVKTAEPTEMCVESKAGPMEVSQVDEPSSHGETKQLPIDDNVEMHFEKAIAETSQETPSQSYEQFDVAMANDSIEVPSQSANKLENSREPSQSEGYPSMETDEAPGSGEPPTQSFEDAKQSEASQSYEASTEEQTNAPTQSYNEIMQSQDDRNSVDGTVDDQSFPTQSYEVEKIESVSENMETDGEISQEGNVPSQSNDIGTDGIGTSSVSTNNSGVNEDETASSSYVPETPENQERDQDQESAISTSSYEIPPCEELNIASSSVIPDTSVGGEHTSIHDNGVPEIPTSSYNLNPDSSSTHIDAVPTSSYEDQVILEQNVSTSYEVPISMPGLEETSSQNFVTESSDDRNEPSSYYPHHQEEEVTPSYYESTPRDITSEASQSYFNPEEATPSYSSQSITPSYYDPRPETEASQSYYSSQDLERTERSSQNVEASQSFYQEAADELRLRQQGEATPTYSARYPVDYTLANSPIERHDLVESSVPATKPAER
ncbi:uncharacterized protein LOC107265615 isoform X2 [Cephus cinctus]|uniref:Uncharacterized protein LOC107265615 isoform X2 n=1 Tax=Cephus cinctus TaxID=211228 RepID=A0AAJ7BP04_CEPCN|nr:uncharacterized protein LOC107265615 isoform X2 [Cephus cinctus]